MPDRMPVDLLIRNVHLPYEDPSTAQEIFDVACAAGKVIAIAKASDGLSDVFTVSSTTAIVDAGGRGLLLPALCHAHIHLDKCFLLDRCTLTTGDFAEALRVTAEAKSRFRADAADVVRRGRRLVLESVASGVTAMRAHVETDGTVQLACVHAALQLKREMRDVCDVQVAVFLQDPMGTPEDPDGQQNLQWCATACALPGVEAVGSAPYVEPTDALARRNIHALFELAIHSRLHLDFHLDYNVDPTKDALVWVVLEALQRAVASGRWPPSRRVTIGHATRLTLWDDRAWTTFAGHDLPVSLVGLPQSDMYMMGRALSPPPRTTLDVCRLARRFDVRVAMAVNNVENAFTPQGPPDPLALCPLAVALFQAATVRDCHTLLASVTLTARHAIGLSASPPSPTLAPCIGAPADFVLLHATDTVQAAACNPCHGRTTIRAGAVVARRSVSVSVSVSCPQSSY